MTCSAGDRRAVSRKSGSKARAGIRRACHDFGDGGRAGLSWFTRATILWRGGDQGTVLCTKHDALPFGAVSPPSRILVRQGAHQQHIIALWTDTGEVSRGGGSCGSSGQLERTTRSSPVRCQCIVGEVRKAVWKMGSCVSSEQLECQTGSSPVRCPRNLG